MIARGYVAAVRHGGVIDIADAQEALEDQRKQLDRTLAEQRARTLNERFATAAEQLGSDKPAVQLAACMRWQAWQMTGRKTGRPAKSTSVMLATGHCHRHSLGRTRCLQA